MSTNMRLVLVVLVASSAGEALRAESIWGKASRHHRNMYADDTARAVGDTLTILINERSVVDNETNRNMSKDASRKAAMTGNADLKDLFSPIRGDKAFRWPDISFDSSFQNKFDGEAEFDTDRSVVDQITVAVEDVLPNGNLVVLGTRYRDITGEKQTVLVSGIVRPSDITFINTIASQRVADFRLVLKLDGAENLFTKPGWFDYLMNVLSPF